MTASGLAAAQAAQKRVDDLEAQLAADRALGYTDKHPDVDRLQREIKQARADLAAAKVQPAGQPRGDAQGGPDVSRRSCRSATWRGSTSASCRPRPSRRSGQIGEYQSRVEAAPVVEQELASLEREYTLEKARYSDLTTRFSNARMAEDLARKQGGERFSVLYTASLPDDPIEPQPLKIMALALVAGLVLGAGAALGREFLDRSVHDSRALQSEFEVPVLGEIPRIPRRTAGAET